MVGCFGRSQDDSGGADYYYFLANYLSNENSPLTRPTSEPFKEALYVQTFG